MIGYLFICSVMDRWIDWIAMYTSEIQAYTLSLSPQDLKMKIWRERVGMKREVWKNAQMQRMQYASWDMIEKRVEEKENRQRIRT